MVSKLQPQAHGEDAEEPFKFVKEIASPEPSEGGWFGGAIAISGNRMVVGEQGVGRAYVYDRGGNLIRQLKPPFEKAGTKFGQSVAVVNGSIVVGEPWADAGSVSQAGLIHLYDLNGSFVRTVVSPQPYIGAQFGFSLASDGKSLAVGESGVFSGDAGTHGRAYVFDKLGNLVYAIDRPVDRVGNFGWSVAISGDRLIVSEPYAQVQGKTGVIHFYVKGVLEQSLSSPTSEGYTNFGNSLGIGHGVVVVGEVRSDANGTWMAGMAHLYDGNMSLVRNLYPQSPKVSGYFGVRVAAGDGVAAVAQYGYIYLYDSSGLLLATISEENLAASDLGYDLVIDGGRLACGAMLATMGGKSTAGLVRVYDLSIVQEVPTMNEASEISPYLLVLGVILVAVLFLLILLWRRSKKI